MATTTPDPLKAVHASGWRLIVVGAISIVAGILASATDGTAVL